MSRHFEDADGTSDERPEQTRGFVFNQTMLRIKEPARSLDFYTRVLGMTLVRKLDFPEMEFSLYFLAGIEANEHDDWSDDDDERLVQTFSRKSLLELTHNWGDEDDDDVDYHDGNSEPKGFGHIGFAVPDLDAACDWFDTNKVPFVKRPDGGSMKDIAFIKDPDGYWIEIFEPKRLPDALEEHLV